MSICGDAGGAEALAPVVAQMVQDGHKVESFTYRQGTRIFEAHKLAANPLDEETGSQEIQDKLKMVRPDLVLTATSFGQPSLETKFIVEARSAETPVLSVLDYWSNYDRRFAYKNASDWPNQLPDKIAIMDELANTEMVELGFSASCLAVTGQPAFDALNQSQHSQAMGSPKDTRDSYSVNEDELWVLFLSSPIASHQGTDESSPNFIGYTEHTALALLLADLESLTPYVDRPIFLLIKPHPREPEDNYSGFSGKGLRVQVIREAEIRPLIAAADLVTGNYSVALVESCLLGKPTISLQPGLIGKDLLPSNRWGASTLINDPAQLPGVLRQALETDRNQTPDLSKVPGVLTDGKATKRVARLALTMIDNKRQTAGIAGLAPDVSGGGA